MLSVRYLRLLLVFFLFLAGISKICAQSSAGCITTPNPYYILQNTAPGNIEASPADGSGVSYQWQVSNNGIYFFNLEGETSLSLNYQSPVSTTLYFQRKCVINSQVLYSNVLTVEPVSVIYQSEIVSGDFIRSDCTGGALGDTVTYVIPYGAYTSPFSQEDANLKAQNALNAGGQSYANQNASCFFFNEEQSQAFQRECGPNQIGSFFTYTIPANSFKGATLAAANQLALDAIASNGQAQANIYGSCTTLFQSDDVSGYYENDNCDEGYAVPLYVSMPSGSYSSTVDQGTANNLAIQAAQNYANQYGNCLEPEIEITGTSSLWFGVSVVLTDVNNNYVYDLYVLPDTYSSEVLGYIPPGTYNIEVYPDVSANFYCLVCGSGNVGYNYLYLPNVTLSNSCSSFQFY